MCSFGLKVGHNCISTDPRLVCFITVIAIFMLNIHIIHIIVFGMFFNPNGRKVNKDMEEASCSH